MRSAITSARAWRTVFKTYCDMGFFPASLYTMSVSSHHSLGGESLVVHLSSDDPTASGTASNFRLTLGRTINLSGDWMVALQAAEFNHIGASSPVYVSTSINSLIVTGSELTNTLAVLPRTAVAGAYSWQQTSTLTIWVPVQSSAIHDVEVELSDESGTPLPVDAAVTTRLVLLLRRAGGAA